MKTVTVDARALRQLLQALNGPNHLILELKAIRGLSGLTGGENPIDTLVSQYNATAIEFKKEQTNEAR